jgi:hypothetical protein
MRSIAIIGSLALLNVVPAAAQQMPADHDHAAHGTHAGHAAAAADSAFDAMQRRGKTAMGVDQYGSVHHFDALKDGGRIELQRDRDDSVGTAAIRAHMREIARAFSSGNFATPAMVHLTTVPGTAVMRARRSAITYEPADLPRGAALQIRSSDPVAIVAIHRFLAFQRREHRVSAATRPAH